MESNIQNSLKSTLVYCKSFCDRNSKDLIVDIEVEQVDNFTFDVYEIRKCPNGHFYRKFLRTQNISDETIDSYYGKSS